MKKVLPILLLCLFLSFFLLGIRFGDVTEVLLNATLLCLHCIGIG